MANRPESDAEITPTAEPAEGCGIPIDVPITISARIFPEVGGGYSAEVPALPGCFTEGETLDEVRANLREAAEGWLAAKADLRRSPSARGR